MKRHLFAKTALACALVTPMLAMAESAITTAASGTITASAKLDFQIVIPKVLFLSVGTSNSPLLTANTTVDLVNFDMTASAGSIGNGTAQNATAGGTVAVKVVGNNGAITVTANSLGALNNGAADTIPWSEISTSSSDATNFPAPAIPLTGAGTAASITVSSGTKVTNRTANWTYQYANTNVVPAGTYGGATVSAQNGRVTYTASMP